MLFIKNDILVVSRIIPDVADLKIKREKICRQDTSFMKKVSKFIF